MLVFFLTKLCQILHFRKIWRELCLQKTSIYPATSIDYIQNTSPIFRTVFQVSMRLNRKSHFFAPFAIVPVRISWSPAKPDVISSTSQRIEAYFE